MKRRAMAVLLSLVMGTTLLPQHFSLAKGEKLRYNNSRVIRPDLAGCGLKNGQAQISPSGAADVQASAAVLFSIISCPQINCKSYLFLSMKV